MSIDKIHGQHFLACDVCGEGPQRPFESFDEAVQYKKMHGWRSRQNSRYEWEDICDECTHTKRREI